MNRLGHLRQGRERARVEGPYGLLLRERAQGYPPEYLLSRIRGRRSRLIRDWRPLIYEASPLDHLASAQYQGFVHERTADGMWRALLQEHGWVYGQMDEENRKAFAPYFLYAELRTIFICMRCLEGEKPQKAGEVLGVSLLSDDVKEVLSEGNAVDGIAGMEQLLGGLSPLFSGLLEAYEQKGLREIERILIHRYLALVRERQLPAVLRAFFSRLIDSRNILALYKSLRMGTKEHELFMHGGMITVDRLKVLLEKEDLLEVIGLVRQAAGIKITSPDPTQVEAALYRGITRYLKGEGRDPLNTALIVEYLWRCQVEVMNLSILLAGKDLDRDEVAAELVR